MGIGEFNKTKLSEEEVKKHEIPEDLSEVERSLILLKKSDNTQRASVLINLPSILRDHPEAEETLLPKIYKVVLSWDEDLQVECSTSLVEIVRNHQLSPDGYQQLYEFILESLESWNNAKWDAVYEQYIKKLPITEPDTSKHQSIIDNGIKLSITLCELSQAIPSR
jgi:hypothetical protein